MRAGGTGRLDGSFGGAGRSGGSGGSGRSGSGDGHLVFSFRGVVRLPPAVRRAGGGRFSRVLPSARGPRPG
ncbi:hypothetical protein C3492_41040 [Streptomyces sp. Ru62]|nr:hypothetical protein C3492_41040 [Streptomyces sp. Ru62]